MKRMRIQSVLCSALIAVAVVFATPAVAGLKEGLAAYQRGDYRAVISELRPLAQKGHSESLFILGVMALEGKGVKKDLNRAAKAFARAATQGHPKAQFLFAALHYQGWGVPKSFEKAAFWARKSADQDEPEGQHLLGILYVKGEGVPRDYLQGEAWLTKAAAHGLEKAKSALADLKPEIAKARQQGLIPAATQQTAAALPHVADQLAGGGQKQVATRAASPTKAVPSLTQQAVAVDATPPTLEINDSVETVGPVVTIEGLVSDQSGIAELSVQGVPVPVGADGRFSIRRGVPVGESEITVAAVDVWGNVAQRQVKVSRTLPQPQAPKVVATTTTATVDKTPPVIETIAGLKTNLEIETISGRVTDASKIASFTIEGKAVALDANGAFSIERKLPIGESHVRMAAVDRFGNQAETVVTILRRPHIPKINYGNYHALIIGNADYQELPKLKTAVVDAKAVAKILEEEYGFEVRLLTDVTRNDMIDAFDELREELGENDNLLVYYAGHGWLDEASGRGYWQPVNAQLNRRSQWMSNATLTDSLKALKAKHVMVVADSCYSGVLTRSIKVPDRTIDYIERMASRRTRVVLTSGGLEPVLDSGGGKHSVFAAEFLKVLENNTAVLDGTQLFERVRRPVVLAAPQTPQYSDIRFSGHDGGDFLFVRKY